MDFVHGGIAFGHDAVHRHAVAGAQRDEVADLQFGDGDFRLRRLALAAAALKLRLRKIETPWRRHRGGCRAADSPRRLRRELQQMISARREACSLTRASSQWPTLMSVMMAAASMK